MKITLVTATYNRANLLPRLYDSIRDNYRTHKDIEWIIIDDGSSDNTKELVSKWIKSEKFDIKYYYQDNAGKMSAINNGMKYVTGDVVFEVDSDDYLEKEALKIVNEDYEKLDNKNVYGILYKTRLIGKDTTVTNMDNKVFKLFEIHNKYEYDFDMKLTFISDIRKKYEYKLEHNEKFVTEARTYYKMDQDYDGLLFKDKDIVVAEYQEDGYSNNIKNIFKKYPYGYYEYFKEALSYCTKDNVTRKRRLYLVKQYILFSYLTKKSKKDCINNVSGYNKKLVRLLVIPGYIKSKRF